MYYYSFVDMYTGEKIKGAKCDDIKYLLETVIPVYMNHSEYIGIEILEYDKTNNRIACIAFNKNDTAFVSVYNKKSVLLTNLVKFFDVGCKDSIKIADMFAGRIMGEWSDLELVSGVVRNTPSKAYYDFNKGIYYFVEYDKNGKKITGVTDKKSIVSALFDDMTITVKRIEILTADKSIYVCLTHDLIGSRLYGGINYKNTFDMAWVKWFRRM